MSATEKQALCHVCGKCTAKDGKHTCGRCKHAVYCGVECQAADWNAGGHSRQCYDAFCAQGQLLAHELMCDVIGRETHLSDESLDRAHTLVDALSAPPAGQELDHVLAAHEWLDEHRLEGMSIAAVLPELTDAELVEAVVEIVDLDEDEVAAESKQYATELVKRGDSERAYRGMTKREKRQYEKEKIRNGQTLPDYAGAELIGAHETEGHVQDPCKDAEKTLHHEAKVFLDWVTAHPIVSKDRSNRTAVDHAQFDKDMDTALIPLTRAAMDYAYAKKQHNIYFPPPVRAALSQALVQLDFAQRVEHVAAEPEYWDRIGLNSPKEWWAKKTAKTDAHRTASADEKDAITKLQDARNRKKQTQSKWENFKDRLPILGKRRQKRFAKDSGTIAYSSIRR